MFDPSGARTPRPLDPEFEALTTRPRAPLNFKSDTDYVINSKHGDDEVINPQFNGCDVLHSKCDRGVVINSGVVINFKCNVGDVINLL